MTGWSYVLFLLLSQLAPTLPSIPLSFDLSLVTPVVIWLECICVVEVLRTALGDLPGNLVLGVVLHAIRFIAVLFVVPSNPNSWIAGAVLLSWAFTEVARYPMYLFPSSETCRSIRMVVPLATFPVGAIAEGYGAYLLFSMEDTASWLKAVLAGMIFVNGVLGPTMAYPALLKKGGGARRSRLIGRQSVAHVIAFSCEMTAPLWGHQSSSPLIFPFLHSLTAILFLPASAPSHVS